MDLRTLASENRRGNLTAIVALIRANARPSTGEPRPDANSTILTDYVVRHMGLAFGIEYVIQ